MPTNEERREVASKLLGVTVKSNVFTGDARLDNALNVPVSLVGKDREQLMAALHHLSVMIEPEPERTCENESSVSGIFTCSYCGADFYDTEISGDWNYCPNCGAKVVENEVTPTPL